MNRTRLVVGVALVVVVAAAFGVKAWLSHAGATVDELATARLDVTASELAGALPSSRVEHDEVETHLRHDVPEIEEVTFTFGGSAKHVTGMKLERAEREEARKSRHGEELEQRFASLVPNADQNALKRKNIRIWVSPTELSFEVRARDEVIPSHTDAQVAIARDLILSIAFGLASKHTDKEVADVLGTGYPVADVIARAHPTRDMQTSMPELLAQFPGSTRGDHNLRIPLVHPTVEDIEPIWRTRWTEHTPYLHVDFHMTSAFRGRAPLAACIAKQPAAELLEVREGYGLGTVDEATDPAAFASLLQAVDACR